MRTRNISVVALLTAIVVCGTSAGQTITVDTSADVVDFGGAQMVGDLPGPDGKISLKEAGLASDNTSGVQTIAFAVPQSDWQFQSFYPGRVVFTPFLGFRVFDTVIIDATTQTDFTGDTHPEGGEVVIWNTASGDDLFIINNVGGEVRGFDSTSISVSGESGNAVRSNTAANISIFGSSLNTIGGRGPGDGNTGGTIKIDRADHNVVVGNTVQRVRVLGFGSAQPALGNHIGGPLPEDRNYITGYGFVNGEGLPGGTTVQIFASVDTIVENNWIGTTPDGLAQGSLASTVGVGFEGENHDTIIRNNRIAGILGHGQNPHHAGQLFGWAILVGGAGSNLTIVGNTIGLDANDNPLLGSVWGIDVGNVITSPSTVSNIRIGGTLPGEGNVVAGHLLNGITIGHDVPQVRISGTATYANGWLGIDLIPSGFGYGVTPNDPLDADEGGNGVQNFPMIDAATREGSSIRIVGSLHSSPSSEFSLEFFTSAECDATGFGEGQMFLGSTSVTTDASGDADFSLSLGASVPDGWVITSTATLEPAGPTSELSACVAPTGSGDPSCGDGTVDPGEQCDDGNTTSGDGCSATCQLEVDPNMLINGDFSAGAAPWIFFTNGGGSFDVVDGEARLDFTADGTNVQLFQHDVAAASNTEHTLSFRARHTVPGQKIFVRFSRHTSPYTFYGLFRVVTLTTTMETYTLNFTTTSNVISDGRLMFLVSGADVVGENIFIDDVMLRVTTPVPCGNGTLDPGETCDGGNLGGATCTSQGFDGGTLACNATCDGFDASSCFVCGDDVINGTEVCDGRDLGGQTCADFGFNAGTLACNPTCDGFDTSMCATCGDGNVDPGEECDDGNTAAGDGCSGTCRLEVCGNGTVDPGEECDDGNTNDNDACSNGCTINASTNVIVNGDFSAGEASWVFYTNGTGTFDVVNGEGTVTFGNDGTNVQVYQRNIAAQSLTEYTLTFRARHSGSPRRFTVRFARHTSPFTYYGLSARVNLTPTMESYTLTFTTTNHVITDGRLMFLLSSADTPPGATFVVDDVVLAPTTPSTCGNGVLDPGETCDGSNLGGETCTSQGFDGGTLACNATCDGFDTLACTGCGNGVIDPGEVCDGSNLGGATCQTQGFDGGTLACDATCGGFDTTGCSLCGDGIVDPGEECDDGNTTAGDGCSDTCEVEGGTGTNLIVNGNFSGGTAPWRYSANGSSSFSVIGGQAFIDIDVPGTNNQLYQRDILLQPNTTYRLTFRGRNTGGDNVRVRMIRHTSPYTNYGLDQVVNLTTAVQTFTMTFMTPPGTLAPARLQMWIAPYDSAGDDYYFDDFVLEER